MDDRVSLAEFVRARKAYINNLDSDCQKLVSDADVCKKNITVQDELNLELHASS